MDDFKPVLTDDELIRILKFGDSSIPMGRAIERAAIEEYERQRSQPSQDSADALIAAIDAECGQAITPEQAKRVLGFVARYSGTPPTP